MELTLNGRVTFNQEQVARVYPIFGGTVTEVHAETGSVLSKKPSPVEPQAYIPFTPSCLYFVTRAFIASVFMLSFSSYIAFKAQKTPL